MKTARRHELKENDLAHYMELAVDWMSANVKWILMVVVGLAVVIGAFFYLRERNRQKEIAAWEEEYVAEMSNDPEKLKQFISSHQTTKAGQLANLALADRAFDEGVDLMSTDREAALSKLKDAKNRYFDVKEAAGDQRIRQKALLGLARVFETTGDLDQARGNYEELVKFDNGLFKLEAERKLKELDLDSTKAFIKWYGALQPKAQPSGTGSLVQPRLDTLPGFPKGPAPLAPTPLPMATSTPTATATGTAAPTATGSGTATPAAAGTATPTATATGTATEAPAATGTGTGASASGNAAKSAPAASPTPTAAAGATPTATGK